MPRFLPPRIHCHDNPHTRQVVSDLHQLHQPFRPTPWLFSPHLQLVFLTARKKRRERPYDHVEPLTMADGGHTALYWLGYQLPPDTPTIVVLHTLTGDPQSMQELIHDLHKATGWRVVLCVRRGHAGLPLPVAKINILGSTHDLREQLQHIRRHFPDSPLHALGSSAGSGLLVRYLGEEGEASVFRSAFAYCPGYNTDIAFGKAHPFYSRLLGKKLVEYFITPHAAKLAHLPTAIRLENARDLADFHRHMYELAGYDSYEDYDAASNPMRVFGNISTPLMVLNSEDDPVCRIDNIDPYREAMGRMPNVILVTTTQGSHCAHYEGWRAQSWSGRLMGEYFLAVERTAAG